jgi:hypothetical protein
LSGFEGVRLVVDLADGDLAARATPVFRRFADGESLMEERPLKGRLRGLHGGEDARSVCEDVGDGGTAAGARVRV